MKLTATKIAIVLGTASLAAGCSGGGGSAESMPTPPAAANSAPTISSIANQTIDEGDATSVLVFTVGEARTCSDLAVHEWIFHYANLRNGYVL